MKKSIIVTGLCLSMAVTGILSGCSLGDSVGKTIQSGLEEAQKAAESTVTEVPETEAPKETVLKLGEKAAIGDWKFKVTKVQVKKKINSGEYYVFKPEKGEQFVVLSVSATNKGKEEAKFLPSFGYSNSMLTATLLYGENEYKASNLLNHDKDLLDQRIKSLGTKKGIVSFSVPKKVAKKKGKLSLRIGTDSEYVIYKW